MLNSLYNIRMSGCCCCCCPEQRTNKGYNSSPKAQESQKARCNRLSGRPLLGFWTGNVASVGPLLRTAATARHPNLVERIQHSTSDSGVEVVNVFMHQTTACCLHGNVPTYCMHYCEATVAMTTINVTHTLLDADSGVQGRITTLHAPIETHTMVAIKLCMPI